MKKVIFSFLMILLIIPPIYSETNKDITPLYDNCYVCLYSAEDYTSVEQNEKLCNSHSRWICNRVLGENGYKVCEWNKEEKCVPLTSYVCSNWINTMESLDDKSGKTHWSKKYAINEDNIPSFNLPYCKDVYINYQGHSSTESSMKRATKILNEIYKVEKNRCISNIYMADVGCRAFCGPAKGYDEWAGGVREYNNWIGPFIVFMKTAQRYVKFTEHDQYVITSTYSYDEKTGPILVSSQPHCVLNFDEKLEQCNVENICSDKQEDKDKCSDPLVKQFALCPGMPSNGPRQNVCDTSSCELNGADAPDAAYHVVRKNRNSITFSGHTTTSRYSKLFMFFNYRGNIQTFEEMFFYMNDDQSDIVKTELLSDRYALLGIDSCDNLIGKTCGELNRACIVRILGEDVSKDLLVGRLKCVNIYKNTCSVLELNRDLCSWERDLSN